MGVSVTYFISKKETVTCLRKKNFPLKTEKKTLTEKEAEKRTARKRQIE